jgi:hypothetical protein
MFVFLAYELTGTRAPFDLTMSSSAHLGGMLTGFLYYRFVHDAPWFNPQDRPETEVPAWIRRAQKTPAVTETFEVEVAAAAGQSRATLRAEIDRILDKINSDGFGALTPAEKRVLDEAKDVLSRP